MSTILYRSAELSSGAGRTVHGVVVPFGVESEVRDAGYGHSYRERIEYGATARSIAERGHKLKLFTGHDRARLPIGKAVELTEKRDGLHAAFSIPDTSAGNDALELVRSGVVDSFSIGFKPVRHRQDGDVTVRLEI